MKTKISYILVLLGLITLISCKKEDESSPFIKVRTPNGYERYMQEDEIEIKWADNIDENVRIDLLKEGNAVLCITVDTESDCSFWWTIPDDLETSDKYSIEITSIKDLQLKDQSKSNFSIGDLSTTNPYYVTVLEPNGGETWTTGTSVTVKWETNYTLVKIYVLKDGNIVGEVTGNGVSGESFTGTLGSFIPGNDYKIAVAKASDYSFKDVSDDNFTIKNPPSDE